jgi:hypothetical protein
MNLWITSCSLVDIIGPKKLVKNVSIKVLLEFKLLESSQSLCPGSVDWEGCLTNF